MKDSAFWSPVIEKYITASANAVLLRVFIALHRLRAFEEIFYTCMMGFSDEVAHCSYFLESNASCAGIKMIAMVKYLLLRALGYKIRGEITFLKNEARFKIIIMYMHDEKRKKNKLIISMSRNSSERAPIFHQNELNELHEEIKKIIKFLNSMDLYEKNTVAEYITVYHENQKYKNQEIRNVISKYNIISKEISRLMNVYICKDKDLIYCTIIVDVDSEIRCIFDMKIEDFREECISVDSFLERMGA